MHSSTLFRTGLARTPVAVLKTASEALQAHPAFLEDHFQRTSAIDPRHTKVVDFDNPESVLAGKTTIDLLRSFAILKSCRLKPLVCNAETLLGVSRAIIGRKATDKAVEATFFKHFCAGTNAETIKPTLAYLKQRGILPILNFAAEDDVDHGAAKEGDDCAGEACLDANARIFMRSVVDCDNRGARGFVSIKVTGLAQPVLLERMSEVLAEVGGICDRGHSSSNLEQVMAAHLDEAELKGFDNMWRRLVQLSTAVHQKGNMRMLVDAEHSYFQPAIDAIAIALQQRFNKEEAIIMNTYQCYLTCSASRIETDIRRAADEGWAWGAKTVRGAYMHMERARAAERGSESPIQNTLSDTHQNYNSCLENVMEHAARGGGRMELMVASHNQHSVEAALTKMHSLNFRPHSPESGIYFGQLLGMADNLSLPLGAEGYNVYKICAYGSVHETIAYLLRRALENSDVLGGATKETDMIRAELARRLNPFGRSSLSGPEQPVLQHA